MGRRRMAMAFYQHASTANPTGMRPWNSRLSFYVPNTFPVPTTGRGALLLQPGVPCSRPSANGGLAGVQFPNFMNFQGSRTLVLKDNQSAPRPIYSPPASARAWLSGLGAAASRRSARAIVRRMPNPVSTGTASTNSTPTTSRRQRGQQTQGQGQQSWWQQKQNSKINSTDQYWQQQADQGGGGGAGAAGSIGTDASGNPIYSTPPSGLVVTGYDAQGNPIYGAATTAADGTVAASTATTASSFFSEDSLGLGLNNGWYLAIGLGLVLVFKKR